MALKPTLDTLDEVAPPLREHYAKADDGKFRLTLDGEHPDSAKLAQFRENNVRLLKDLARFEGITDPDAARTALARVVELDERKPDDLVAALEAKLTRAEAALSEAREKTNRVHLRHTLRSKALAAGAVPAGVDLLIDKAEALFTVTNEVIQAKPNTFSPTRPGEPLTADEWLLSASQELPFLFKPSTGSGAARTSGGVGASGSGRELRDPSPQQLGQYAREIASGDIRVVYSS